MKQFIILLVVALCLYTGLSYFAATLQSARSAAQEPVECATDADCAEMYPNINPL